MNEIEMLYQFEEKNKFLYGIQVNGVPIYTCFRDGVLLKLQLRNVKHQWKVDETKGRIYPKRIFDGIVKLYRFRNKKSLVFTSSVYRRDKGRNLAAEYLLDRYPESVVFEWPARNDEYDKAYFNDLLMKQYCPLDFYPLLHKIDCLLHKKQYQQLRKECRDLLKKEFQKVNTLSLGKENLLIKNESVAVTYLLEKLPDCYADTVMSQRIFRRLFRHYDNAEYAIDFWGGARENIIPILPGKPMAIELQHGIITATHGGYIYPQFLKAYGLDFFKRKLLVYGEKTKELLVNQSIFSDKQIEVIGNPRIQKYKKEFSCKKNFRNLILFTSQPFEQDGYVSRYYETMIPILKEVQTFAQIHGFEFAIKLHPRENNGIAQKYEEKLPGCSVYDNYSQLYELLAESFLQITANSTSLYEAAEFGTPTITIEFANYNPKVLFGSWVKVIRKPEETREQLEKMLNKGAYNVYLKDLQYYTSLFM